MRSLAKPFPYFVFTNFIRIIHDELVLKLYWRKPIFVLPAQHTEIFRLPDSLIAGDMAPRQGTCQESSSARPKGQRL